MSEEQTTQTPTVSETLHHILDMMRIDVYTKDYEDLEVNTRDLLYFLEQQKEIIKE